MLRNPVPGYVMVAVTSLIPDLRNNVRDSRSESLEKYTRNKPIVNCFGFLLTFAVKFTFTAHVLVARRVLSVVVGDPSYIQPPPKNPNGLDLFDSVVDSITRPSIFMIFADAQAYSYPDLLLYLILSVCVDIYFIHTIMLFF